MLKTFSIKNKMMLFVLGTAIVTYLLTIGYISFNLRSNAISKAKTLADTYAELKANDLRAGLNEDVAIARTMADIVRNYADKPKSQRDSLTKSLMVNVFKNSTKYEALFLSWELQAIDPEWKLPYGRERLNFYKRDGLIQSSTEFANLQGDDPGSTYARIKEKGIEELSEPYKWADYDYSDNTNDSIFGASPVAPIMKDGKFIGVIGTDLTLEDFKNLYKVDFYEHGYSILITNEGAIISHPDSTIINTSINHLPFAQTIYYDIVEKIKSGEPFSETVYDRSMGEDVYISFAPLEIGRSGKYWSAATLVPISEITASFNTTFNTTILVAILGLGVLTLLIWRIASSISNSLSSTSKLLKDLSIGNIISAKKLQVQGKDEIGEMVESANALVDDLKRKSVLAESVDEGNLDTPFELSGSNDVLGRSLLDMRNNLKSVIDETKHVILKAGDEGSLDARILSEDKSGAWKDLSELINNLLHTLSTPVRSVNEIVTAMADGDMTSRYVEKAEGEIKRLADNLNMALNTLNNFLAEIDSSSDVVKEASEEMRKMSEEMSITTTEIASAITQMSHGAQSQVTKVDESSKLVEGILNSSTSMGDKAETINQTAKNGLEHSKQGVEMANKIIHSMSDISYSSQQTNESIQILKERSDEISRVLNVITDIAAQTNLLALNAAIEAAQAGEAGRGFAVVAEEIRKLAEDSRKSASEIEKLVVDVQKDTNIATEVIKTMTDSVVHGEEASNEASKVFKAITESSSETFKYSEDILNASRKQIEDIHQVVSITESVVVIAEQTAAGTEEIASSATELSSGMTGYNNKSEQLAQIAAQLEQSMSTFKLEK